MLIVYNFKITSPAIYKTRNTGTGGGMRKDSGECSWRFPGTFKRIPRNVWKKSEECSKRFLGMFKKIPVNVQEDSGECSKRFRWMFIKIPGNLNLDLFCKIFLIFYQILLLLTLQQNKGIFSTPLIATLLLATVFLPHFSFLFSFSCRGKGVITVLKGWGIKKL